MLTFQKNPQTVEITLTGGKGMIKPTANF